VICLIFGDDDMNRKSIKMVIILEGWRNVGMVIMWSVSRSGC